MVVDKEVDTGQGVDGEVEVGLAQKEVIYKWKLSREKKGVMARDVSPVAMAMFFMLSPVFHFVFSWLATSNFMLIKSDGRHFRSGWL